MPTSTDEPAPDDPDERRLRTYAVELADGVQVALPGWVERSVETVLAEAGHPADEAVRAATRDAGQRAAVEVGGSVRDLLLLDIDDQRTNPLALLREAVVYPTAVLREAGARPVDRDATDERLFPDDVYGLTPAAFGDIDPALHEPGLAWGAAKAFIHLQRRRAEGRR